MLRFRWSRRAGAVMGFALGSVFLVAPAMAQETTTTEATTTTTLPSTTTSVVSYSELVDTVEAYGNDASSGLRLVVVLLVVLVIAALVLVVAGA